MNTSSVKIKHRKVNLNNLDYEQIEIYERNSNYSWFCCMIDIPNQSYLKDYVHKSFFESNCKIIKETSGRPILLKNNKKDRSISISHKESIYTVAQSSKKRHSIGIDVENYDTAKDYSFIAKSLRSNEYLILNEIQRLFNVDLNKSYLCIWTIKECLVKISNRKVDWHDIEIKMSKYGHFDFYLKNICLNKAKLELYFYKNIILSVVYI